MEARLISRVVRTALESGQQALSRALEKNAKIEHTFRDLLKVHFEGVSTSVSCECDVLKYGGQIVDQRKAKGYFDLVVDPGLPTSQALELKVIPMPRRASNPLYDIGQVTHDYLRIASIKGSSPGWIIIFVHGKMLIGLSERCLYKEFHNQMFVDWILVRNDHRDPTCFVSEYIRKRSRVISQLGWNSPRRDAKATSPAAFAVKPHGNKDSCVGAICLRIR